MFQILNAVVSVVLFFIIGCSQKQSQESINIAVASNFFPFLQEMVDADEQWSQYDIRLISGPSTQLAEQIVKNLPVDLFFAADKISADYIHQQHIGAVPQPYTVAELAWVLPPNNTANSVTATIVIANPQLAPFGHLAKQWWNQYNGISKLRYANNVQSALHLATVTNVPTIIPLPLAKKFVNPKNIEAIKPTHALTQYVLLINQNSALAQQILNWVLSPQVQQQLSQYGFQPIAE